MTRSAIISRCSVYRYELRRQWNPRRPRMVFVMLNPSIADAAKDDATIRKCIGFADRWGYGGFTVVNLFAFRTTYPRELKRASESHLDVIGSENNDYIEKALGEVEFVVAAWGAIGGPTLRALEVARMLPDTTKAIQVTSAGWPSHPLMLSYDLKPELWRHKGLDQ